MKKAKKKAKENAAKGDQIKDYKQIENEFEQEDEEHSAKFTIHQSEKSKTKTLSDKQALNVPLRNYGMSSPKPTNMRR